MCCPFVSNMDAYDFKCTFLEKHKTPYSFLPFVQYPLNTVGMLLVHQKQSSLSRFHCKKKYVLMLMFTFAVQQYSNRSIFYPTQEFKRHLLQIEQHKKLFFASNVKQEKYIYIFLFRSLLKVE